MSYNIKTLKALYKETMKKNLAHIRPMSSTIQLSLIPIETHTNEEEYKMKFIKQKNYFLCSLLRNIALKQANNQKENKYRLLNDAQKNIKPAHIPKRKQSNNCRSQISSIYIKNSSSVNLTSSLKRAESATQIRRSKTPFVMNQEKLLFEQQRIMSNKMKWNNRIGEVKEFLLPKQISQSNHPTPRRSKSLIIKQQKNVIKLLPYKNKSDNIMNSKKFPIKIKLITRNCVFENEEIRSLFNSKGKRRGNWTSRRSSQIAYDNINNHTGYVNINIQNRVNAASGINSPIKKRIYKESII